MLETIIGAAAGAVANTEGAKKVKKELSVAVWDYIRPIFLKDDPEEGKKQLAQVEAAPDSAESQELIKSKLTEHLADNPESAKQLQQILQQGGGIVINNMGKIKNQFNNNTFDGPVTFN